MSKQHKPHESLSQTIETSVDNDIKEVKREWHHFLKFKDENRLLFMAFLIAVVALVSVNCLYIINLSQRQPTTSVQRTYLKSDVAKILTSQQTGANSAEQIRISDISESSKTDYAYGNNAEQTMLTLTVTITNKSSSTQHLIPVSQFYVRSDEGEYAAMHPSMYITQPLAADELKPNQTATGQISFSVPKKAAHPLLYVDTTWGNVVPIVFDVLH
jgi:hypothetical protein